MNAINDGAGVTAQARAYLDAHLAVRDEGWTADDELRLTDLLDAVDAVHAGLAAQLESGRRANSTLLLDLDRACKERNRALEELERVSAEAESLRKGGEASVVAARSFKDDAERLRNALNEAYGFQGRLEACAEKREDVTLWGVDYVALPEDADEVTIRPLDWVTDYADEPFEVGSISIIGSVSGWTVYDWEERDNDPSRLHHCEKPKKAILKDILKDFAIDCSRHHCGGPVFDDLAENLASHLQLVEDGDGAC